MNLLEDLEDSVKRLNVSTPQLHVVLGSGFGEAFENLPTDDFWEIRDHEEILKTSKNSASAILKGLLYFSDEELKQ